MRLGVSGLVSMAAYTQNVVAANGPVKPDGVSDKAWKTIKENYIDIYIAQTNFTRTTDADGIKVTTYGNNNKVTVKPFNNGAYMLLIRPGKPNKLVFVNSQGKEFPQTGTELPKLN